MTTAQLNQLEAAARAVLQRFINRAAAQQLRRMREHWSKQHA